MKNKAVITGGGSGLGQALAWILAARDYEIWIIGRRDFALAQTASRFPDNIQCINEDVAKEQGRQNIVEKLSQEQNIKFLVHNAGIIDPIAQFNDISLAEWRKIQNINVEAPLFLTQALLPQLKSARILHISSGVAHIPKASWMAYCTSKAALFMIYQCLKLELKNQNVFVGSVMPGIVDTPMVGEILRSTVMPEEDKEFFQQIQAANKLIPTHLAAAFLAWLLCDIPAEEFSEKEWDIYDEAHHHRWLMHEKLPNPFE